MPVNIKKLGSHDIVKVDYYSVYRRLGKKCYYQITSYAEINSAVCTIIGVLLYLNILVFFQVS